MLPLTRRLRQILPACKSLETLDSPSSLLRDSQTAQVWAACSQRSLQRPVTSLTSTGLNHSNNFQPHQQYLPAAIHKSIRCKTVVGNLGPTTRPDEHDVIRTEAGVVSIEGYDEKGFFVNGVAVDSAIACTGNVWMVWKVSSFEELTEESLMLSLLLKPSPELLILGCGRRSQQLPGPLQKFLVQHRISAEVLDTPNAISTFNILNQEGRQVIAALLPAG